MQFTVKFLKFLAVFALSIFLLPAVTQAQHYKQTNLVSNLASITTPNPPDPNLRNPWGLTRSSTSPWWVGNNNSGTSTLYTGAGVIVSDRKSTRLNSSHVKISYAVFCLKKKKTKLAPHTHPQS